MKEYFNNITFKEGIWVNIQNEKISFPEEGYDTLFQIEDNSFWFKHRNSVLITLAQKFFREKAIVDIGGGNGYVSWGFQQADFSTIMVEPGINGCLNSKRRGVTNNICATIQAADPIKNGLPNVGSFDVIEHIDNDSQFVKDVHQYLKQDGYFLITVPAYNWLWSQDDINAGHFRRHTIASMKQLLEKNGYEIEFATYIFSFLVIPIFLFRSLPYKLGLAKKGTSAEGHGKDHNENKGIVSKILQFTLKKELNRISNLKKINFGSSVLIVAKKK